MPRKSEPEPKDVDPGPQPPPAEPMKNWRVRGATTDEDVVISAERMYVTEAGCLVFMTGRDIAVAFGPTAWKVVEQRA